MSTPSRPPSIRDVGLVDPKRIVVMRALHLGDLLVATPALRALRHRFPAAEITLVGLPWAAELVARLPSIDRLVRFPGYPGIPEVAPSEERTSEFLAEAHHVHYDLAIQMHGDGNLSNGFIDALGARTSIGYRRIGDDRLTLSLPYIADEHEVIRWLRLAGLTDAETNDRRIEYPTTPAEARDAAALLDLVPQATGPLVGLHPGASTAARRWPAERFAALADALVERWDSRIVLSGTEPERELNERISQMTQHPVLNLAGQTDLGTFAALIGQLDLLITNDTGASHLAAASGTPSVVIFATSPPRQWAPLDHERHLVVDARTFAPPEVAGVEALARLPLDPVLLACERHLDLATGITDSIFRPG